MRLFYAIAGVMALTCGTLGIILPLVPTVPFLILAAFCFAKSSPQLHNWLVEHPLLGPPIQDWRDRGAISLRGKRAATISILLVFSLSLYLGLPPLILIIQGSVLCCVLLFIWSRPTGSR
ncbi:MAG: uncharacterized membrane protein YbaN (DUF454 family) [Paracoccaceae bacterium]|jgi:uncharacterized membrane protein YbaN (DUF454 family)